MATKTIADQTGALKDPILAEGKAKILPKTGEYSSSGVNKSSESTEVDLW